MLTPSIVALGRSISLSRMVPAGSAHYRSSQTYVHLVLPNKLTPRLLGLVNVIDDPLRGRPVIVGRVPGQVVARGPPPNGWAGDAGDGGRETVEARRDDVRPLRLRRQAHDQRSSGCQQKQQCK